jgi:hypothetical protein
MIKRILVHLAMAIGVVAFSGLFILLFGNRLDVTCIRPAGQNAVCKISKALLGEFPTSTRAVSDVVDVEQDRSCDDGCTYRTVLVTSSGQRVPVNDVFTDQGPVIEQMSQIRNFLDGVAPAYEYTLEVPSWVVPLMGGLGLVGLAAVGISFVAGFLKR